MSIREQIILRFQLVYFVILIIAFAIFVKIIYLQTIVSGKWKQNEEYLKDTLPPKRGDIYAYDGKLLATSIPYFEVRVDAFTIHDSLFNKYVDTLSCLLAKYPYDTDKKIKWTKAEYAKRLKSARKNKERYVLLYKKVDFPQFREIRKWPIFKYGRNKGGLIVEKMNERKLTYGKLGQRTIGREKKGDETRTLVGVEGAFEHYLRGVDGYRMMKKVSANIITPVSESNELEPEDGMDIVTSLDVNMQDISEAALQDQLKKHNAKYGCVVVMEVQTGEIKAMANLAMKKDSSEYIEDFNYAVGELYEPGSTFKLASMIALFEDKYVGLLDTINTGNGTTYFHGFPITDTEEGGYGRITVQEVFEHSSNVGVSKLINNHYQDKQQKFISRLSSIGLTEIYSMGIKGEKKAILKTPSDKHWSKVSLPQISIGYEVLFTPIQILTLYNAVANEGKMVKPKFVKEIRQYGRTVKAFETEVIKNSICSKETLDKVKKMLIGVVKRGTATNIDNSSFDIAGKTGTAKIYNPENNKYTSQYNASFVGYFPAENPKFSCIVFIHKPSEGYYYGSSVAAPVFKEIADKIYSTNKDFYQELPDVKQRRNTDLPVTKDGNFKDMDFILASLDISREYKGKIDGRWINTMKGERKIHFSSRRIQKSLVPDVEGMGLKDALYLLEKAGLEVEVNGRGMVRHQSLQPGTRYSRQQKIKIELTNT